MKKSIVLICTLLSVLCITAQRTTRNNIKHKVYGNAIVESKYNKDNILVEQITYTRDTAVTKNHKEIGEISYFYENKKLKAKGNFIVKKDAVASLFGAYRKKNGKWLLYNETENLIAEINYLDDRENGPYIYYHKNGKIGQTGTFSNGKNVGIQNIFFDNGKLHKSTEYKNGLIHNIISLKNKQGNNIEYGTLKDGNGTMNDYDLETGKLKNTYTLEDGLLNIIDTKVVKTPNGNIIEKKYKNRDGSTDKITRAINGILEGTQEYYNYNGKLKETINYTNGVKNGKHTKFNDDGTLFFEYNYVNNKKLGAYKYTPEGFKDNFYVLDEGYYDENEKFTGNFTRYLQNKQDVIRLGKMSDAKIVIESGAYKNHNKIGVWKTYDETGNLTKEINFSAKAKDNYVKKEYFNDNKTLKSIVEYDNEKEEGTRKVYYENGQLRLLATYKNQALNGAYKEYFNNGQLKEEGQRKEGKKIGYWKEYKEDGKIMHNHKYETDHCCAPSEMIDYYYHNDGNLSSIIKQFDHKKNPSNENESYFGRLVQKKYSENGNLSEVISKKKNNYNSYSVLDGLYQQYSISGKLKSEGYYSNDKKTGTWKYYKLDGTISNEVEY
ncbi:toxin-antitoxin system YwqK family antitoxin [Cellulophaga omnivescoria]|uniref:toxin-antitoxin system YwqK family antitoxin n=1 Tax=Cellulophaga omnivescoria TaxID=1888890 RepID=UPI000984C19F|nr:hypothetical protein [Cellulophaga omnivescoria]